MKVIFIKSRGAFLLSGRVLSENLSLRAADLYSEGLTFEKVSEELEVSKGSVGNLIRKGIREGKNQDTGSDEADVVQPDGELENNVENKDEFSPLDFSDNSDLDELLNRTILIHATPILRKVALNSKVFLQHEYFQKQLGYEGDVGDLLVEALDYYWKEMGFTIKITHDLVM